MMKGTIDPLPSLFLVRFIPLIFLRSYPSILSNALSISVRLEGVLGGFEGLGGVLGVLDAIQLICNVKLD